MESAPDEKYLEHTSDYNVCGKKNNSMKEILTYPVEPFIHFVRKVG